MDSMTLTLIMTIMTLTLTNATRQYEVNRIKNNPGVHYEKGHIIKMRRAEWQVIIGIEVGKIMQAKPMITYEEYSRNCRGISESQCKINAKAHKLTEKNQTLINMQEELRRVVQSLAPQPSQQSNTNDVRRRRLTPFGFIGSVSHSLFGLVTDDEIQDISDKLQSTTLEQKEIVKLMAEKTHILAAELNELHTSVKEQQENLDIFKNQMIKEVNDSMQIMKVLDYSYRVSQLQDKLIETYEKVTRAIKELRENKISKDLLTDEILSKINTDILQTKGEWDLPIPTEHLRAEELMELARSDVTYHEGRVLVIIKLPLVDRTPYNLYKMYPLNVPQVHNGSFIGMAYIKTTHTYIAMDPDHQHYMKLDEQMLGKCIYTRHAYICPITGPLKDTSNKHDCELEMLIKSKSAQFTYCDIQYSYSNETQWQYIESDASWLFSTAGKENIRVICNNKPAEEVIIEGAGILKLNTGCKAQSDEVILLSEESRTDHNAYMYTPEANLDLMEIHPELKDKLREHRTQDQDGHSWKQREESLQDIVNTLTQISYNDRNQQTTHSMIAGNYALYAILTLTIIIIYIIKCAKKRKCWEPIRTHDNVHQVIEMEPTVKFNKNLAQDCQEQMEEIIKQKLLNQGSQTTESRIIHNIFTEPPNKGKNRNKLRQLIHHNIWLRLTNM
ncbi:hypothetical protein O181_069129 [Austropuccinia psidii MF-1]|uniref:Envelope protein n=1 Tax=Austropuccinia psidii MF-1 TaxID=1389203 RepID=A0A9Q3EYN7_9BASI|nr:hypothetical protein [Austropuccinia psidii MF-1]